MTKILILLRHADALDKQFSQPDVERELSSKGINECIKTGQYLSTNNIFPDVIFSSTAERTRTTTTLIADALKCSHEHIYFVEELYEASTRTFLQVINNIDNKFKSVICVGHNPTISYLAEYLTKAEIGSMATGSFVRMTFELNSWNEVSQGTATLQQYISPAML